MDALPVELLERICILASCDGGRTACSLRLVSRTFYDLSETYWFHTVAISSRNQAVLFRDTLRHSQANLRHLFIAAYKEIGMNTLEAVEILRRASPVLETLICLLEDVFDMSLYTLFISTSFPRLVHLTFRHPLLGYPIIQLEPERGYRILYPELRALHVAYTTPCRKCNTTPCSICTAHEGLSAFIFRAGALASDTRILRQILGLQSRDEVASSTTVSAIPKSVQSYVLDPCFPREVVQTSEERRRICAELGEVGKESEERDGPKLVILPSRIHERGWCLDHKPPEEWQKEWMLVQSGELSPLFEWTQDAGRRPCRDRQTEKVRKAPIRNIWDILQRIRLRTNHHRSYHDNSA
ncbi:hypothetical protein NEOLEDRAFT_611805 [Neolentinus lepideus HHB14362 ss-1]|uniref:F-box domain-containing protein n=1 Tax=Neolentinus lepideus HHB14362 ss-1 TaxID=1314782 RepID=A0A165VF90_9AGAM|nr:hypothetical protein NEOLEDRAFT_611805 [Neolentinus lepideus HHB14362 ss-1]